MSPRLELPKARAYRDFRVGDIFDIHPTSAYKLTNDGLFKVSGNNPVVANGSINNGIVGFSGLETTEKGNMITFSDTTTSDAIFYQPNDFIGYPHVQGLYPKKYQNEWNEVTLLYFMTAFKKCSCGRFDYATKFTRVLAADMQVKMPVNDSGEIDFLFIEKYMQAIKDYRINELNDYLDEAGFEDCTLTIEEEQAFNNANQGKVSFISRPIDSLMNGQTGDVDIQNKDINGKGCYFINSGITEFGIKGMTDRKAKTFAPNSITIDFFGNAYYRPFEYKLATHNHVFSYSGDCIKNEAVGLFIVTQLGYLSKVYSYSNMGTMPKYNKHEIELPVDQNGNIDYSFMETYIRAIMKQTIGKLKAAMAIDVQQVTIEEGEPKNLDNVAEHDRFTTHLPVYPLRAACGYFDDCGQLQEEDAEGWIDASGLGCTLNDKMFVVHAEGDSMEPKIHDGDFCVFDASGAGSREGKIVLCKARDKSDRNASSFTIKKYHSEKIATEEGWMHSQITLSPLNSNYNPIIISAEEAEDDEFKIYGEFICVI